VQHITPDDVLDRLEVTPGVAGPHQVKLRDAAELRREKEEILKRIRHG